MHRVAKLVKFHPLALEHTRHVCFMNVYIPDVLGDFLSRCEGIVNLAVINARVQHPELFLEAQPLQRLSFPLATLQQLFPWPNPFDGSHPIFSRITHLDILDNRINDWRTWSGLAHIPQLTHLSSHDVMSDSVVQGVLKQCKRLEVLIFVYSSQARLDGDQAHARLTDDPRFVMLVVEDRLVDWETGSSGGEDYWAVASALVKKRRSGGDV
ncbi:hypothetical protein B0H12DRAFT_1099634 [Mycena haematopus]|nr:hypothetical protein B0H12DRAFT_1099634 [Mycena haematopus]